MFACFHGPGDLTALAFEFSPLVEQTAPETVALDASGLDLLLGLPQDVAAAMARRASERSLSIAIALASNPDAAICAARGFPGVSLVPQGDEAKFLAPLPLSLLAPSPDLAATLESWGIRRFHDLASLLPLGIAERLGREGLQLRELARGEAVRKLLPIEEPLRFEDEIELEDPVDLLEPLAFLLARLLNGLATRLATRGLATDELRLALKLENRATHNRTLRLPVPALDTKAFLKLMQLDLAAHPPQAPVTRLRLGVNPVKARAAQTGLFIPLSPEPVKLEITLARIKSMVGEDRVGYPQLLDTHRPSAFGWASPTAVAQSPANPKTSAFSLPLHSEPRSAPLQIRLFRPPRPARVALVSGQPSQITAAGIRGAVLNLAGPWRTSGDWWTNDPWQRDEWDVALSDGVLYRVSCEPAGWFVQGAYD
jgi:protein ImuB